MSETFTDITCTVCGCLCDDLEVQVEHNQLQTLTRACRLAEPWWYAQAEARPVSCQIQGEESEYQQTVSRAVELLSASRSPLIYGLSRSCTAGQRAAIELADYLGACIDTTASVCHAPSIQAIQQEGEPTCTLGEVKNRSDLVIFWGIDPVLTHPRHLERYSLEPEGRFVPNGREDRTLIVINDQPNETSQLADLTIHLPAKHNFEMLWALRQLVKGRPLSGNWSLDIPLEAVKILAERMKSCQSGIVFFGLGMAQAEQGHLTVEALLKLTAELNDYTRFYARRMRLPGDVSGADSILCWQTGFPFAVNLQKGYPRYNPQEYSIEKLLERQEVDLCLFLGSESYSQLSSPARKYLEMIPTICLDYPASQPEFSPTLQFVTGVYGMHYAGTAYRMDEVPLPLRTCLQTDYPSDQQVLSDILNGLKS